MRFEHILRKTRIQYGVVFHWTLVVVILSIVTRTSALMDHNGTWTGKDYPDLRGPTRLLCGSHMPLRHYLCDPDHLISKQFANWLNIRLHALANSTKCQCKRIGQCVGEDLEGNQVEVGFIVGVAFVKRLYPTLYNADKQRLLEVAGNFCTQLRGRWALGDCGNSAIIVIWEQYKFLYILPDRLTKSYLTLPEVEKIREKVQGLVAGGDYKAALEIVLTEIEKELKGDPEERIDIGQLSLIVSVAVAIVFVFIITGCVCAFRCCGNLRPDRDTALGQTLERVDSLKAEVIRRGSVLRRSLSRSPKLPHYQAAQRLDHAVPLIQSQSARGGSAAASPNLASNRQLRASVAAQQLPKRTNMARLATPYYRVEDGHSMV